MEGNKLSVSNPIANADSTYAQAHFEAPAQVSKRTLSKRSILPSPISMPSSIGQPDPSFSRAKAGTVKPVSIDWQAGRPPHQEFQQFDVLDPPRPSLSSHKLNQLLTDPPKKTFCDTSDRGFIVPVPRAATRVSYADYTGLIRLAGTYHARAITPDEVPLDPFYQGALGLYTGPEMLSLTKCGSVDMNDMVEAIENCPTWLPRASFRDHVFPQGRSAQSELSSSLSVFSFAETALNQYLHSHRQPADMASTAFNSIPKKRKREGLGLPCPYDQHAMNTESDSTINDAIKVHEDPPWATFMKKEEHSDINFIGDSRILACLGSAPSKPGLMIHLVWGMLNLLDKFQSTLHNPPLCILL
ncbi:hypothetical protein [Phaffia rhodozyma]|uniref:Uncharacterized protein n=1 Tax=Phaffia rhodozyma TaxID=264483 RepID=A0A0F7SVM9_PHARH|nr:hypothetical protein [Phaffia rhodozyma]